MSALLLPDGVKLTGPMPKAGGGVIYVDGSAPAGQDGSGWAAAFVDLQSALDVAHAGSEIRVADGTYRPTLLAVPDQPRSATFALASGITLRGGYAGNGAPDPDANDVQLYSSILSGDIGVPGAKGDNCLHVVTASGTNATAVLDGFTITAGQAQGSGGPADQSGGGLFMMGGSPTVRRCTIIDNGAGLLGGGVWSEGGSPGFELCTFSGDSVLTVGGGALAVSGGSPRVTDSTFSGNATQAGNGGAVFSEAADLALVRCTFSGNELAAVRAVGGSLTLADCTFTDNMGDFGGALSMSGGTASVSGCGFAGNVAIGTFGQAGRGGAVALQGVNAVLVNVRFHGNEAWSNLDQGSRGGALHVDGGMVLLANGVLTGNRVDSALITSREGGRGAAVSAEPGTMLAVTGCTLHSNHADTQPGGLDGSDVGGIADATSVSNTILHANTDYNGGGEFAQLSAGTTISYCCVEGWTGALGGTGNLDGQPSFADADGADDTFGTEDDDLHLQTGSSCIDAGDNALVPPDALDLDGDGVTAEPLVLDLDRTSRFADDTATPDTGAGSAPLVDLGAYERSAWNNLGQALAGELGHPLLVGQGTLTAAAQVSLVLTSARENAPAWLVAGVSAAFTPFKGDVLVPDPSPPGFAIGLATDGAGTLLASGTWPPSVPPGFLIFFQYWIVDPDGVQGLSASNAVGGQTP